MPTDHLLGQAEFPADLTDLVLEELAQRLDQREWKFGRQPADVVVRLDCDRWAAGGRVRLDHVRVEGSLHQKADIVTDLLCLAGKDVDEAMADAFPLDLGVGHAGEIRQEFLRCIDRAEVNAQVPAERTFHLLPLAEPKQSVVDKDTGEPVAHRAMHQRRCDG